MLSKRPDVKQAMVENGCKVMIIGRNEEVCDLPEYAHICDTLKIDLIGTSGHEVLAVRPKIRSAQALGRKTCFVWRATGIRAKVFWYMNLPILFIWSALLA